MNGQPACFVALNNLTNECGLAFSKKMDYSRLATTQDSFLSGLYNTCRVSTTPRDLVDYLTVFVGNFT
jgi:hypothetical protein